MIHTRQATMTSRERCRRAFRRQIPDRVPINYIANPGIDRRLKAHFGLAPDDTEGLRLALGVDFRGIAAPYRGPVLHGPVAGRRVDPLCGIRSMWIEHSSGGYWDFCDFPLADADDDTIAHWPLPSPDDFDYSGVAEACARWPDHCLHVGNPGLVDIMNWTGMLRGQENVMLAMGEAHEATMRLIDRKMHWHLEMTRRVLEAAGGRIDLLWIGEDLGTQRGPMISMDTWRTLIRPRHQRFVDLGRQYGVPVMIHSCGSSSWAYGEFIDMGISAVDTVQPEPVDMAPAALKARFGGQLAFHGCLSTAGPVAFGSVEQTTEDTRRILETMMPGGGYCASPTHALQDNSPTDNVLAMYDAIGRWGWYDGPA